MTAALYRLLTDLGAPAIELYLRRRADSGREEPARAGERRGIAAIPRPEGPLIWLHGASVGESLSVLPLIGRLLEQRPDLSIMVTTGTVTSAALLADRLPPRAFHQYVPVDRQPWVDCFLAHWQPDLAIWVESELWPNLVLETRRRSVPMALVNGRMSRRSYRRWRSVPRLARTLLGCFELCLGQTEQDAARLARLGAPRAACIGNLKFSAPPLEADPESVAMLERQLEGRPCWLAASTHPGEEARVMAAHHELLKRFPDLLTVIVPRHASRGETIARDIVARGALTARRSQGDPITPETQVYVADTMGELGLFYRLAGIVFIGGSLVRHGGQNLLEPAQLDSAILHGPHMMNFRAIVEDMTAAEATVQVTDADTLAEGVAALIEDPDLRQRRAGAAARVARAKHGVLDAVMTELAPWLDVLGHGNADTSTHHARA